jgi:capsular polysaccharide biosynthesis protein
MRKMNEDVIRVQDLLKTLKKRWKLICIITIITVIISAALSFFVISPKYETSTKVFIGKEGSVIKDLPDQNYNGNDVEMYQKLLKTYAEIIKTNDLIEKAVDVENLDVKPNDVLKNLTVTPTVDTQILEIKYVNQDKVIAKNILDSITNQFIVESKQLIPNGNIKIIESVKIPEDPVSPNKKINITISFILGLMISIGLSFLLEFMDNTFNNKEEMEKELGLPVLGTIPDFLNE